jgi:vitamin B12 transporter
VGSLGDVSRYRTDNVSNARARGLEASAAWRLPVGISMRGTYTLLDTEIRAVDGTAQAPSPYRVGDRLLRRPTHHGSVAADWTRDRLAIFAALQARGETFDAEPSFGPGGGLYENEGHIVFDVGGSYALRPGLHAFARVLNLFDSRHEEVLGYPSPGRTAYAGIRIAAGR